MVLVAVPLAEAKPLRYGEMQLNGEKLRNAEYSQTVERLQSDGTQLIGAKHLSDERR